MKTKIMALFAMSVLALAVAGTAYAAWAEIFTINGNANMGTFEVVGSVALDSANNPFGTQSASYTDIPDHATGGGGVININLNNAVPGSTVTALVTFQNTGTLPAKILSIGGPTIYEATTGSVPTTGVTITTPGVGTTIAAGTSQTFSVVLTVDNTAIEGGQYTITVAYNFGLP